MSMPQTGSSRNCAALLILRTNAKSSATNSFACSKTRLSILREADTIVQSEMEAADWYYKVWQSFAVLLPVQSVGVMGDQRTYENTIALRIVESQDGMTADWVRIPYELLARISNRICNEVKGVNRVVYDISSKPPSTIEWE